MRTTAQAPAGSLPPPQPPFPGASQGSSPWTLPESRCPPAPRTLQEQSFPHQGPHCLPGLLHRLLETPLSTSRSWEGRGPEATPFLEGVGTSDALSSCKVLAPAPSDPTFRAPLRPPPPAVPRRRRSPCWSPGCRELGISVGPQPACALHPGVPAWMRSANQEPPPVQTPRSRVHRVPTWGTFSGAPGHAG